MRLSTTRSLVVLAVVASLGTAVCSDGGGTVELTDANVAAVSAAERTAEPGTARFALTYDAVQGTEIKVSGEGSFDFDEQKGSMQVNLGDQSTELVVVGDTLYGKLPGLLGQGAKPWISFKAGADAGSVLGGLDQLVRLADPRQALVRLPLATQMKRVAAEKVRGVSTVHFRGIVDLSDKSLAKLPAATRNDVRAARTSFGLSTYPIDLWLDEEGRVRRFTSQLTGQENGEPVSVKTRIELFNFGDEVSVTAPSPDQVQDASNLGGLGGE